jgi:hypothetical protein
MGSTNVLLSPLTEREMIYVINESFPFTNNKKVQKWNKINLIKCVKKIAKKKFFTINFWNKFTMDVLVQS